MLAELCALIALAVPPARVDAQEFEIRNTKITVRVDAPWPKALNHGWQPVFVQVENREERAQRVDLSGNCWGGPGREVTATLEVEAGGTASIELLVPAFANISNGLRVQATAGGERGYSNSNVGAQEPANPQRRAVLVLAPELPAAGTPERWTSEVSTEVAQGPRHVMYGIGLPHATTAPAAALPNNICIAAARFDQMASRSEAYSSLDVVVLDTTRGLPEAQRLAPLLAWAELGGTLLIAGPRAQDIASSVPELARWMEERFQRVDGLWSARNVWRLGLGWLCVDDRPVLAGSSQRDLLRDLVTTSRGLVEDSGGWRRFPFLPVIPDLFALPLKGFAIFLMFFAVLIGPVNFIVVKRTKKPAFLLLSIPAIAIAAAFLLFAYGVASQGLGVKVASESLSVLDQREHRASSAEVRMIFAGLSPGAGLEPRPGTSCYAIGTLQTDGTIATIGDGARTYRVDQTDGFVLTGQFIPSRTAFLQQILSEHAERARLGIEKKGASYRIENGLGARIERLFLRDASGDWFQLAASLENGASKELEAMNEADAVALEPGLAFAMRDEDIGMLPPGCYLARLDRNPFGDDCGVTGEQVSGKHHVLGVLALDAEEWR